MKISKNSSNKKVLLDWDNNFSFRWPYSKSPSLRRYPDPKLNFPYRVNRVKKVFFEEFFAHISKTTENFWILTTLPPFKILCSTTLYLIVSFEISTEIWKNLILFIFWPKNQSFQRFSNERFKLVPDKIKKY